MISTNDLRIDLITSKLKIIEDNIRIVKENLPKTFKEFRNLGLVKDGIYKKIEASIQEILKVCSIIYSDLKLGLPNSREDIVASLVNEEILSTKIGEIVRELKGFRNFLVHRYGEIDDKIAYNDIKEGITDSNVFITEIKEFIDPKH